VIYPSPLREKAWANLDEGALHSRVWYTLIQLRLGSKLPSLHILLPHGRRQGC
jgi:hypothetical protein